MRQIGSRIETNAAAQYFVDSPVAGIYQFIIYQFIIHQFIKEIKA
jgi:hypothetical protein